MSNAADEVVRVGKALRARIKAHEGYRALPYIDTTGHATVGYGHKIQPITEEQADKLFESDLAEARRNVRSLCQMWNISMDFEHEVRLGVLVEMAYQMGRYGLARFQKMLSALRNRDWDLAAKEMLDSAWAQQTPARAKTLASIMQTGKED